MEYSEFQKAHPINLAESIEYVPLSVVIKTILKKTTGNVSVLSFDSGEAIAEKVSPFDTLIQVIDGTAQIQINEVTILLETGQSIIIPAHTINSIEAKVRFKIISTIIKSGYEEFS